MTVPALVSEYARASRSTRTKEAYREDWADFTNWANEKNLAPLPASPETVAYYLADRAGVLKPSTLARRLVGIRTAHRLAGYDLSTGAPVIRETLTGIKREHGSALAQKAPLTVEELRLIVAGEPSLRNRALLVIGFAAALRRSEIAALDLDSVEFTKEGAVLFLLRRKNDQEGAGTRIGLPYGSNPETCPVRLLAEWLEERGEEPGPLFPSKSGRRLWGRNIADLVKSAVRRIGLDHERYSGHSLRAGFATEAARAGASERSIMRQTGHRSLPMVRRYIREGDMFRDNAAAVVGL